MLVKQANTNAIGANHVQIGKQVGAFNVINVRVCAEWSQWISCRVYKSESNDKLRHTKGRTTTTGKRQGLHRLVSTNERTYGCRVGTLRDFFTALLHFLCLCPKRSLVSRCADQTSPNTNRLRGRSGAADIPCEGQK